MRSLLACLVLSVLTPSLPGASILQTPAPAPDPADFLEAESDFLGEEKVDFQHEKQRVRKVIIRGALVELDLEDRTSPVTQKILGENPKERYPTDLAELEIHAIELNVKGAVWLPGTNVKIQAGKLSFVDEASREAFIMTTSLPYPERAGTEEVPLQDYLKTFTEYYAHAFGRSIKSNLSYQLNYAFQNVWRDRSEIAYHNMLLPILPSREEELAFADVYLKPLREKGPVPLENLDFSSVREIDFKDPKQVPPGLTMFINFVEKFYGKKSILFENSEKWQELAESGKKPEYLGQYMLDPLAFAAAFADSITEQALEVGAGGAQGLSAGNVSLAVSELIASEDVPRFVLQGGPGQQPGKTLENEISKSVGPDTKPYYKGFDYFQGPLFSYQGLPVLLPSYWEHADLAGEKMDNEWLYRGADGLPEFGLPGSGGSAGDLNIHGLDAEGVTSIAYLEPGEVGPLAEPLPGLPPSLEEWYEIRILETGQSPAPGLEVFEFPGAIIPTKRKPGEPVMFFMGPEYRVKPFKFQLHPRKVTAGAPGKVRSAEEVPAGPSGSIAPGTPAEADLRAMDLGISWMRENFLGGYVDEAFDASYYLAVLYGESEELGVQERMAEITTAGRRMAEERDYFGNPAGWTPAGSLNFMLRGYERTLEQTVETMVTAMYLEHAWKQEGSRDDRRLAMMAHFSQQLERTEREAQTLQTFIDEMDTELERNQSNFDYLIGRMEAVEGRMEFHVEQREMFRHELLRTTASIGKFSENFAGVSADAMSELKLGFLGFGMDIANSGVSALAEGLRYDLERLPDTPSGSVSESFRAALENKDVEKARRDLQELSPLDYSVEEMLQILAEEIVPTLAAATARSTQKQMEEQLRYPEEARRLYLVLFTDEDPYLGFQNGGLQAYAEMVTWLDEKDANVDIEIINPRTPESLEKFRNGVSNAKFQEIFATLCLQMTNQGVLESKKLHAEMMLAGGEAQKESLEKSLSLLRDQGSGVMDLPALSDSLQRSVQQMRREAEDRLLFQKYCLIQAYHYRVLEPCEVENRGRGYRIPVNVSQLEAMRQTEALMKTIFEPDEVDPALKNSLGEEWAGYLEGTKTLGLNSLSEVTEVVQTIHKQDMARIAQAITDELLVRDVPRGTSRRLELDPEDLELLNQYGEVRIDLEERRIVYGEETNARLIAVHFGHPENGKEAPEFGDVEASARKLRSLNLRMTCELADASKLRWGQNEYRFVHARDNDSREVIASFNYNPAGGFTFRSEPLASESSLLLSIFGIDVGEGDREQLKTYKGARTKITLRLQTSDPEIEVLIEKLVLYIDVASNEG